MADRQVTIDLIARDRGSRAISAFGTSADKAARRTEALKRAAGYAAAAIATLAVKVGIDSVHAYADAQTQQAKLQQAFAKFPGLADTNIQSLRALNTQLEAKTKFDDDATASGQAVLAQFKLTGQQITQLTPLLQDYAARTGKDLPTAATDLGRALLGNSRALKTIGVDYKATGNTSKDFASLQQALNDKVGGFATREGKTAAGQAEILRNQFGEVEEAVGSKLVPALTVLAEKLISIIEFVQRNQKVIVPLVKVLATVGATIYVIVKAIKIWTAVQAALDVVLTANPIGLVVIAIAALVAGLILAYKKSETFRAVIDTAMHGVAIAIDFVKDHWQVLIALLLGPFGVAIGLVIKHWDAVKSAAVTAIRFVVSSFLSMVGAILNGAAKAFGWVPGIGGKLKSAASKFDTFRDQVNASLDGIRDKTVTVSLVTVGTGRYAGKTGLIEGRANGGPVTAGTPYIVGERRPELFVPDRGGRIMPQVPTGGGGVTIEHLEVHSAPGERAEVSVPRGLRAATWALGF